MQFILNFLDLRIPTINFRKLKNPPLRFYSEQAREFSKSKKLFFLHKHLNKRGDILVGNIIFLMLNFIFLSILILFLMKQGSGAIVLEQAYAKQIALLIDSSKPVMELRLNMEDAKELAEKNKIDFSKKGNVVQINGNLVTVKLSESGGYSYSFFNDVEVGAYPDGEYYIFTINNKENQE
jgi:hypothetical protein